jgi:hypothetical protein
MIANAVYRVDSLKKCFSVFDSVWRPHRPDMWCASIALTLLQDALIVSDFRCILASQSEKS